MPLTQWNTLFNSNQYTLLNTGTTLSGSTSSTSITPGVEVVGQACQIPAGFLQSGMALRFTAAGILTSAASSQGTLALTLWYGGTGGVSLAATGALTLVASGSSNTWELQATSRVLTVGTGAGTIATQGVVYGLQTLSAAGTSTSVAFLPNSSATGGTSATVDTGTAKVVTLGAQFSSATTNTITCYQWVVEFLN